MRTDVYIQLAIQVALGAVQFLLPVFLALTPTQRADLADFVTFVQGSAGVIGVWKRMDSSEKKEGKALE